MTEPPRPRTMHEFADRAGLSRPTVSKFFNDPRSVRPSTRARIEAALRELDFRPNFFALNQNRRSSRTLGILVPQLADPFYAEAVRRIEAGAIAAGLWPVLLASHGEAELERRAVDALRSLKVAGALIAPLGDATDRAGIGRLAAEVPVVLFDTGLDDPGPDDPGLPGPFAFVGTDHDDSVGRMVAHLCATGSPPCFLGFPAFNSTSRERRDAYLRAMAGAGHQPHLVPLPDGGWDFERLGFEVAAAAFARGGFPTTTLLCANDRLAIGVLAAAHEAGLRVGPGGDLRVAGHDDHPLARFTVPALTTVAQDFAALSEAALALLLGMAEGRGGMAEGAPRALRLPTRLILRRSA